MKLDIQIGHEDVGFRYESIKSLLRKFDQIEKNRNEIEKLQVTFDILPQEFHELSGAFIWRLARYYQHLPCKEKNIRYSPSIEPLLKSRHFLDRLTGQSTPDFNKNVPIHFESFSPFRNINNIESGIPAEKIYENAIKTTFDKGNDFHSEVKVSIQEILNNVFDHSESNAEAGIIVATNEAGHLGVCAVDMGQGIKKSFLSNPFLRNDYSQLPDYQAIQQATKFKISCNPEHARHPNYQSTSNAGIGLYFLKKMAQMHQDGQLILISEKGYYYIDSSGREIARSLQDVRWPGTAVYFRVKLDQRLNPAYSDLVLSI